ncbi:MAG TPA: hypothetical protein VE971_00115 [Candidatus Eisenbacteria bacterium]|nr:hypothetical protein [Candidatus Eisenbacteria bacterium]
MGRKSILLIIRDYCTMSKSQQEIQVWRKKIEMVGIDIKSLDQDVETNRFKLKTKLMNQHFINELDKIGLQLINIKGTFNGKLVVLLEPKVSLQDTP